ELADRPQASIAPAVAKIFADNHFGPLHRAHGLWLVKRTTGLAQPLAARLAADSAQVVRVHLMQALGETPDWQSWQFELVRAGLADVDPFVRRAAATALAMHPDSGNIAPLVRLLGETPAADAQLMQATRIALRDQLRSPLGGEGLAKLDLPAAQRKVVLAIAALTPTPQVAAFFQRQILAGQVDSALLREALPIAAAEADSAGLDRMVGYLTEHFADDSQYQLALLRSTIDVLAKRGHRPTELMNRTLTSILRPAITDQVVEDWTNTQLDGAAPSNSPWVPEERPCRDGQTITVISSLREHNGNGEHLTGVLHSPPFAIPPKLSFWICGHDAPPGSPAGKHNFVRLVLADGSEVARVDPPRNDVAQRVDWDLTPVAGKSGTLEVVDGDTGGAYAWLAIGRIEPAIIRLPQHAIGDHDAVRADAVRLAGTLRLTELTEPIEQIAAGPASESLKTAAAEALVALRPQAAVAPLAGLMADSSLPVGSRQHAAELLGRIDTPEASAALAAGLKTAPQPLAIAIAAALAPHAESAKLLLAEIRAGRAAATLLREPTVTSGLKNSKLPDLDPQIAELTAKLSPADDRIAKLIVERRAGFLAAAASPEAGRAVFERTVCKNCHKIGAVGGAIGPALDGIGTRGLDRLLEDTLDPSRNVDQAFRVTLVETDAGQTIAGFGLREEGETLVMYDSAGKEIRLPRSEVESKTVSQLSPMPANIPELISEAEYYQLLAFLLSQRPK
ncbi:MAG TPA: HEAT repeat domain-containing protein, partial [Pirellulales bacterium]|nr:HEAT repeat domain-containing protein [Pirellulales bacterium]